MATIRKQFSVTMDNRPGTLARMCTALAEHNVNILALMSVGQNDKSLVRMLVDKTTDAVKALDAIGYRYSQEDVLTTTVAHRPGTLSKVAKALGDGGVNVNYAYLGTEGEGQRHLLLVLSVSDVARGQGLVK
ncbi:MAG: ACT domain-containing protein [Gemmatimonadetes bacterium]|nr:ACT domain-containing protein [Gemmatimonadota bacterium]